MRPFLHRALASPPAGLTMVILLLGTILTLFAGTHVDRRTGLEVNNFLNSNTLVQTATDASFFAIMAVGPVREHLVGIDSPSGYVLRWRSDMAIFLARWGRSAADGGPRPSRQPGLGLVCGSHGAMVIELPSRRDHARTHVDRAGPRLVSAVGSIWCRRPHRGGQGSLASPIAISGPCC